MVVEDMPVGLCSRVPPHGGHVRAHHADEHSRARVHLQGRPHREDALAAVGGGAVAHWPFIAIQTGWITAEVGRQPWVVYPSVTGPDGVSAADDGRRHLNVGVGAGAVADAGPVRARVSGAAHRVGGVIGRFIRNGRLPRALLPPMRLQWPWSPPTPRAMSSLRRPSPSRAIAGRKVSSHDGVLKRAVVLPHLRAYRGLFRA